MHLCAILEPRATAPPSSTLAQASGLSMIYILALSSFDGAKQSSQRSSLSAAARDSEEHDGQIVGVQY